MTSPSDVRAVTEYRIPARSLRPGDLVNCSPGIEEDWQQVLAVHVAGEPALQLRGDAAIALSYSPSTDEATIASLVDALDKRYVVVELTDVAPVDGNLFFEDGVAMAYETDDDADQPVLDLVEAPGTRTYLYTAYEVVTVRNA